MHSELDRDSNTPIYEQIAAQLRGSIDRGDLRPFARVPSEIELAMRSGTSRMTARKALDRLVGEGLLFRRQGKGTFVARGKIEHAGSTQISLSALFDSLGLPHATKVMLAGVVVPPDRVAQMLRVGSGSQVVCIRRVRLLEGEPVALHVTYLPQQYAGVLVHDMTGSLTQAMAAEGLIAARGLDSLSAVRAAPEEAAALHLDHGAVVMRVEGTASNAAGQVLRYTDSRYRGDRFRFTRDTDLRQGIRLEVK